MAPSIRRGPFKAYSLQASEVLFRPGNKPTGAENDLPCHQFNGGYYTTISEVEFSRSTYCCIPISMNACVSVDAKGAVPILIKLGEERKQEIEQEIRPKKIVSSNFITSTQRESCPLRGNQCPHEIRARIPGSRGLIHGSGGSPIG
ncbi:hypothetical protein F5B20DRAFT_554190 [Whalleya microplaca]|nr:hypothetical protein F5B20DRAFT_554190 [Whalleya microplaca]